MHACLAIGRIGSALQFDRARGARASGQVYVEITRGEDSRTFVPREQIITFAVWKAEQAKATQKAREPLRLSAAEHARLDTFTLAIAGEARGNPVADSSGNWRFGSKGGCASLRAGNFTTFRAERASMAATPFS